MRRYGAAAVAAEAVAEAERRSKLDAARSAGEPVSPAVAMATARPAADGSSFLTGSALFADPTGWKKKEEEEAERRRKEREAETGVLGLSLGPGGGEGAGGSGLKTAASREELLTLLAKRERTLKRVTSAGQMRASEQIGRGLPSAGRRRRGGAGACRRRCRRGLG